MNNKTEFDFDHSINSLLHYLENFHRGTFKNCYINMSGELRKLVSDKEHTLLPRVYPDIKLMRVSTADQVFPEGLDLRVTCFEMVVSTHKPLNARLSLSPKLEPMLVAEWIEQPLLSSKITIRQLIKSMADKMDAHSDETFNDILMGSHMGYVSSGGHDYPMYVPAIIALSKHIIHALDCHEKKHDPVIYFSRMNAEDKNWGSYPY